MMVECFDFLITEYFSCLLIYEYNLLGVAVRQIVLHIHMNIFSHIQDAHGKKHMLNLSFFCQLHTHFYVLEKHFQGQV